MKNRAIDALIEMGIPANIKGFNYIAYAMELFQDDESRLVKTTYLYHLIGARYHTTSSCVERAIRHAFSIAINKGNLTAVNKYLTLQNTTSGNLLSVFYLKLNYQEEQYEKNKTVKG